MLTFQEHKQLKAKESLTPEEQVQVDEYDTALKATISRLASELSVKIKRQRR